MSGEIEARPEERTPLATRTGSDPAGEVTGDRAEDREGQVEPVETVHATWRVPRRFALGRMRYAAESRRWCREERDQSCGQFLPCHEVLEGRVCREADKEERLPR